MKKKIIFFLLIFQFIVPVFSFDILLDVDFKKPFKKMEERRIKKRTIERIRMVETKEQWLIESGEIPVSERVIKEGEKRKTDDKQYFPDLRYVFEKYNYPQGARKIDIQNVKENLVSYPVIVADSSCHFVAYVQYYYSPDINQISSNFYVGKLDTTKTKTQRILDYRHNQEKREPIIEAGVKELYPNYFRGLNIVDWSADSKKILLSEKTGSTWGGIYKTSIYVYFLDKSKVKKLDDFDETIKEYYSHAKKIDLIKYSYEIVPMGFASENDDIIIIHCYLHSKDGKRIFMGTWSYNLFDNEILLLSSTNPSYFMSANGLVLKQVLY